MRRLKTVRRPPVYPKTPGHLPCSSLTHPLPLSFGGFGLNPQTTIIHRPVSKRLGHASVSTTLDIYAHSLPSLRLSSMISLTFLIPTLTIGRR